MSLLFTICALHFVAQLSPGPDVLLIAKSSASTTQENTEATLQPNRYAQSKKDEASTLEQAPSSKELKNDLNVDCESIIPKP